MTIADMDDELTTSQAKQCLEYLERRAFTVYMSKARSVSDAIRDFMVDNFGESRTTRVDFEMAVRFMADDKYLGGPDVS